MRESEEEIPAVKGKVTAAPGAKKSSKPIVSQPASKKTEESSSESESESNEEEEEETK